MKEYNIGDLVLLTLDSPGPVGITEGLSQYKERKFRISKVKTIIPKNKSAPYAITQDWIQPMRELKR